MRTVHGGPLTVLPAVAVLLGVLATSPGLGPAAVLAGGLVAVLTWAFVERGLRREGLSRLGVANVVTLTRAVLTAGVTALVVQSWSGPVPRALVVAIAAVALATDLVDGRLARRTGSVTRVRRGLRHGDRRVPDPGPQRVRRPAGRAGRAADRSRAVPAGPRRSRLAVADGAHSRTARGPSSSPRSRESSSRWSWRTSSPARSPASRRWWRSRCWWSPSHTRSSCSGGCGASTTSTAPRWCGPSSTRWRSSWCGAR